MTLRSKRRLIWGANAAMAAALAGCAYAVLLHPPQAPAPATGPADRPQVRGAAPAEAGGDRELAAAFARDLRKPLFDPQPVQAAPAPPPPPPTPTFSLTGTMIEPGGAYGLFRTRGGETKLAGVGETIEGARVVTIEEGKATVDLQGHTITLTVQRER